MGKLKVVVKSKSRLDWNEYFMEIVHTVAKRATCNRGRSGCVVVKDNQILATGYVGSPSSLPHCDEVGHLFRKELGSDGELHDHCMRTAHAEQNAICQAAKHGVSINGSTLYCTMTPCRSCTMMIINSGIKKVICDYHYPGGNESDSIDMFKQADIDISWIHEENKEYEGINEKEEN